MSEEGHNQFMLLGNVLVGAMGKSADNDEIKKIASRISCQYTMSTLLFPACLIGCIFTGIWGINYDVEGGQLSTNRALAAVILIGIILVFLVNLVAVCTIRSYGKHFNVVFAIRSNESGLVIQHNVNVISSDKNRQNVNQIEQENRLFQQQLALQQHILSQQKQQQQQHFTGGVYPTPPPPYSEIDLAYPPITSFPEPSATPLTNAKGI